MCSCHVKDSVFLKRWGIEVCLCKGCDRCCVTRGIVGTMSFCHADVVCLYLVCILWQFSMLHSACSLLMLVEDARGDHMEEAYSRAGLRTAL